MAVYILLFFKCLWIDSELLVLTQNVTKKIKTVFLSIRFIKFYFLNWKNSRLTLQFKLE